MPWLLRERRDGRHRGGFTNDTISAPDGEASTIVCGKRKADTATVDFLGKTVFCEKVRLQAPTT